MPDAVTSPFVAWENFYVIIGSSAAGLTGLMFVVVALVADLHQDHTNENLATFGTPQIVHFCAVLLVAAILSAPWRTLISPALTLGTLGILGLGYEIIIAIRAKKSTGYQPVLEDWIWHNILPCIAYASVILTAIFLPRNAVNALFGVAGAAVLLLLVGIHNAWDTATYVTATRGKGT